MRVDELRRVARTTGLADRRRARLGLAVPAGPLGSSRWRRHGRRARSRSGSTRPPRDPDRAVRKKVEIAMADTFIVEWFGDLPVILDDQSQSAAVRTRLVERVSGCTTTGAGGRPRRPLRRDDRQLRDPAPLRQRRVQGREARDPRRGDQARLAAREGVARLAAGQLGPGRRQGRPPGPALGRRLGVVRPGPVRADARPIDGCPLVAVDRWRTCRTIRGSRSRAGR